MNGRLAKKLRKAVGFHPADDRYYNGSSYFQYTRKVRRAYRHQNPPVYRGLDQITNSVGSPRYEYQQSKRRNKS